jgi:hypothetical protein
MNRSAAYFNAVPSRYSQLSKLNYGSIFLDSSASGHFSPTNPGNARRLGFATGMEFLGFRMARPRGGASYGGCRKRCPSELTSRTFDRHSKQRKHRPRTLRKRLRFLVGRIGVKTNHYCWLAGRPRFTQLDVPTLTTSRVHATKLRVRKYSGTVTCNGLPDSRSRRNVLHPV